MAFRAFRSEEQHPPTRIKKSGDALMLTRRKCGPPRKRVVSPIYSVSEIQVFLYEQCVTPPDVFFIANKKIVSTPRKALSRTVWPCELFSHFTVDSTFEPITMNSD